MTYSGYDIFTLLNQNSGTTRSLDEAQIAASELKDAHVEFASFLQNSQSGMANFWQGSAATTAGSGLSPLIKSSTENSVYLDSASRSMYDQNHVFHTTRGAVVPVAKDRPNDYLDIASYNPFGASDSEKAAAKWDADTRHNVNTYEPYYQTTQANNARMPVTYPDAFEPGVPPAPPEPPGPPAPKPDDPGGRVPGPGERKRPGTGGGGRTSNPGGLPGSGQPQPGGTSGQASNPSPSQATTPGGFTPPVPSNAGSSFGPGSGGFGPGSGVPGSVGGSDFGPMGGFGPLGGGGYSGGGSGPSTGSGGGSGSGSAGGRLTGAGGGAAGELGAGKGSGVGMGGKPGAVGGAGMSSPAGARGAAGMGGGMGAGGGKGQGGEDTEHERKIMLSAGDPDSVFGDDLPRTAPPVIGA